MNEVAFGLSIAAILLSLLTAVFSILAYAEVLGMKKSTHKVEWATFDPEEGLSRHEEDEARKVHEYLNGAEEY